MNQQEPGEASAHLQLMVGIPWPCYFDMDAT